MVLLIICVLSLSTEAKYGGGTGEPDDPYLIYTAEQMNEIGANWNDWDKHFKLMANINLSVFTGRDFRIIGRSVSNAFRGVFDGNNHKISRFTSTRRDYTGLFGYVRDYNAEIKNLGLSAPDVNAEGGSNVGSLVSYLDRGVVANCYAAGGSVKGKQSVGGLVGYNKNGKIKGCYATSRVSGIKEVGGLVGSHRGIIDNSYAKGFVSGDERIGGLVGRSSSGSIINSVASGRVSGERRNVGGLVGDNSGSVASCSAGGDVSGSERVGGLVGYNPGTITCSYSSGFVSADIDVGGLVGDNKEVVENCYAAGSVTGKECVGGLVGTNTWPAKITNCYSIGAVEGTTDAGGLVGFNDEAIIKTSFWDSRTSGRDNMCGRELYGIGCDDTHGKTTAQMQMKGMFFSAGWDFVEESVNGTENIWSICEGQNYPQFARQFRTGDFNNDTRVNFKDFAILAERWLERDNPFFWCRGTDLTDDGEVNYDDLKVFAENWPTRGIGRLPDVDYVIIDDFESYNDLDPGEPGSNRIFDTWLDGYDNPSVNGAVVGNLNPPYTEQRIVHKGNQSMPYLYNTFFKCSKAERSLSPPQDWSEKGEGGLSLWFRGNGSNTLTPLCIVLNGRSVVYHENTEAVRIDAWTEWAIDLQAFKGVDLTNIYAIAICFGDQNNLQAGGMGKVFFDDIQVYWSR